MADGFLLAGMNPGRTSSVPEEYGAETAFDQQWKNAVSSDFGLHGPIVVDKTAYLLTKETNAQGEPAYTLVGYGLDDGRGTCRINVPTQSQCYEIASDDRLI